MNTTKLTMTLLPDSARNKINRQYVQNKTEVVAGWNAKFMGAQISISTLEQEGGCFICRTCEPENDDENLVLWRTAKSIVVLNHFPYNNGHLLIAPVRHIPDLQQAGDDELLELTKLVR
jgi:ATP adenylyltransferase